MRVIFMIIKPEWMNDNTPYKPEQIDFVIDKIKRKCFNNYLLLLSFQEKMKFPFTTQVLPYN